MKKKTALITGASGEVGHGLIKRLAKDGGWEIVTLDIQKLESELNKKVIKEIIGNVTKPSILENIFKKYNIDTVFHLASILSTGSEKDPEKANDVNIVGTLNLLKIATADCLKKKKAIKFIFPSSVAVYGMPNLKTKTKVKKVDESMYTKPTTLYGIHKLFCEQTGYYFSKNYRLLSDFNRKHLIDFRVLRFPGIISSQTMPSGGTSDFAPEILHHAAQSKTYSCFVRPDTKIPFMSMEDAVRALLLIANSPRSKLKHQVYNVRAFSASAKDIEKEVKKAFPKAATNYKVDKKRQQIVDSWPEDIDDKNARSDWGWFPKYNFSKTFNEILIPEILEKYHSK